MEFSSPLQKDNFKRVCDALGSLGYGSNLVRIDYEFGDWFADDIPTRKIPAVAFGQSPFSYDTACFGVALSNGIANKELVMRYRALGTPILFEVGIESVKQWAVGIDRSSTQLLQTLDSSSVKSHFASHVNEWGPDEFLRSKNIGNFRWSRQLGLFEGVIPELEHEIQSKLDPLLRNALSAATSTYLVDTGRTPNPYQLFKLIFWLLTSKVFHDRKVQGFSSISQNDKADSVLAAVAKHYKEQVPQLLTKKTREEAFKRTWQRMDFRNLSVDVLSQIWAKTLVDEETQKKLGIHRTSRSLAKYVVDRIPFDSTGDEQLLVLEPCCGSAVFLVTAIARLRKLLWGLSPKERHRYFSSHLSGIEKDPFGAELSRLSLTLADFPNANGWDISTGDVFSNDVAFETRLGKAGVVLCNPPFEDFTLSERMDYNLSSVSKPVEILNRTLKHLHPRGVLGFILPRNILDGQQYRDIRRGLASRFSKIEVTQLPDKAFDADHETVLLIATNPFPHDSVEITHRKVGDNRTAWREFEKFHTVSSENSSTKSVEEASFSFSVPELNEVWSATEYFDRLGDISEIHRGIEWNKPLTSRGRDGKKVETGWREELVQLKRFNRSALGVPPGAVKELEAYTQPDLAWLDVSEENRRGNAHDHEWSKPKIIINSKTKSRGAWRLCAFVDFNGLVCYQTTTAIWLKQPELLEAIAAVINSPVANAFVATREGKTDITIDTLRDIPIPRFTSNHVSTISKLVRDYQYSVSNNDDSFDKADSILRRIDAIVLAAYGLPPDWRDSYLTTLMALTIVQSLSCLKIISLKISSLGFR